MNYALQHIPTQRLVRVSAQLWDNEDPEVIYSLSLNQCEPLWVSSVYSIAQRVATHNYQWYEAGLIDHPINSMVGELTVVELNWGEVKKQNEQ